MIYENCMFGGSEVNLVQGRYDSRAMGLRNDVISSIRVPKGYTIEVFKEGGFRGESMTFYSNVYCLDGRMNDQISSIIGNGPGGNNGNSGSYNPPPSYNQPGSNTGYAGITAYVASWFGGEHAIYNEGRHDLRNASVKNNISSLAIQPGYRVTVYEDFGFWGRSQTFTSSVANLQGLGWNDNIRSMIVSRSY